MSSRAANRIAGSVDPARDRLPTRPLHSAKDEVVPGGVPGIRALENFVEGAYPILLERGSGGRVVDG